MNTLPYRWEDLREEEFEEAAARAGGVCVLPVGCLEMHGQHLSVGTDVKTVRYVAEQAAAREYVCVFPSFPFGDINGLYGHRGGIVLSVELLQSLFTELCAEIARNGFQKILILNGHGGNVAFLQNFLRSTDYAPKHYTVMFRNEYQYGFHPLAKELRAGQHFPTLTEEDVRYLLDFTEQKKTGGHACLNETSIMLAIDPDHVRMDRMHEADGVSRHKTDYLQRKGIGIQGPCSFWLTDHPDSYEGDHPEGASARIGQVILERRIALQAEACRLLKADDRVLEWREEWNRSQIRDGL